MTPLVLVHGFMGGSAQWSDLIRALTARGVDVFAVDLPGFGKNAELDPIDSIEAFAIWVIQHLNDLGIERYDLLGHSMGGMIVQEVARRDAVRVNRLVLYATGATGVLPGRFETIAESKRRARADGAVATARRISATWFLERENAPGYAGCARVAECASAGAIQAGLDAMEVWSGEDALAEIAAETLVLWGDRDRTYAWPQIEALWTRIPDTQLAVLPNCAHAVHLEKPELFTAILAEFLTV